MVCPSYLALAAVGRDLALQALIAFAVVAATFLDPLQTAIGVSDLVGIVLIEAGVHPSLTFTLFGIFRRDGGGKQGIADGGRGYRRGRW